MQWYHRSLLTLLLVQARLMKLKRTRQPVFAVLFIVRRTVVDRPTVEAHDFRDALSKDLCETHDRSVRSLVELRFLLLLRLCQIDNADCIEVAVLALVLFLFLMMSKEKRASLIFLHSGKIHQRAECGISSFVMLDLYWNQSSIWNHGCVVGAADVARVIWVSLLQHDVSTSRQDRHHLRRMSLNCSNEFKIFGGIVVWSVKTGEIHVLAVALKM